MGHYPLARSSFQTVTQASLGPMARGLFLPSKRNDPQPMARGVPSCKRNVVYFLASFSIPQRGRGKPSLYPGDGIAGINEVGGLGATALSEAWGQTGPQGNSACTFAMLAMHNAVPYPNGAWLNQAARLPVSVYRSFCVHNVKPSKTKKVHKVKPKFTL